MRRSMGVEAIFGVGGGRVTQESMRNLKIAEDLCAEDKFDEAVPFLNAAMKDPRNLDAQIEAAFLVPSREEVIQVLNRAEKQGRQYLELDLGPNTFIKTAEEGGHVGDFWLMMETRPYMRVMQYLVDLNTEVNRPDLAAKTIIEMLRLNPRDNQAQRYHLAPLLVLSKQYRRALSYVQAWIDDPCSAPDGKRAPCKTPLEQSRVDAFARNTTGEAEHFYSAALAAFKFWGDCELARQYLYVGARQNNFVLTKILAKVDKPRSLIKRPRMINGLESAHDYLWLIQDAWMAPDVWAWADSCADAKACTIRVCSNRKACDRVETRVAEFKRCSSCHFAFYCCRECQKADWKRHKSDCKMFGEIKKNNKALDKNR